MVRSVSLTDLLATDSKEIVAAIEGISQRRNVCLAISRMVIDVPSFKTIEVPNLSADRAQDAFYSVCSLERSPTINDLIENLDFHPLSIVLLAGAACEKS